MLAAFGREMRMKLDPGILRFIEQANAAYDDEAEGDTLAQQRATYIAFARLFNRPNPAGMRVSYSTIPGPGGAIPIRVYVPASAPPAAACVLYFHGGGWILGNLDSHDTVTAGIAEQTAAAVVAVDYRLAPEHPFPAPFDDCYVAFLYLAAHSAEFGVDAARIALAGDSAGGNLAAAVALAARDRKGPAVAGQALIYPALGTDFELPSHREQFDAPLMSSAGTQYYWSAYLGGEPVATDPYAAPLLARDLAGLPPTFITTAYSDPVRDDGEVYGDRLAGAGVPAERRCAPGLVHGWLRARFMSDEAAAEFAALCTALRRFLSR